MKRVLTILLFSFFAHKAIGQQMFFALNQVSTNDTIPFITEWVIPSNSYTLNINPTGAGSGSNYTVDWGDGTVNSYTTAAPSHVYTLSGTYEIQIKGVYKSANFQSQSALRKIIQWGDVYCTSFTCKSSGLDSITTVSSSTFFSRCTSLLTAFYGTPLKHIPVGLLNSAAAVTTMNQIFYNCTSLTDTIPAHLFDYCTALQTIQQGFRGSHISGTIPQGLLDYCINLTDVSTLFFGCSYLTGDMPTDFHKYNTLLTTVAAEFYGCTGLTGGISADFFKNCTALTALNQTFQNCTHITFVSATAFSNTTSANNFSTTFNGCSGITSAVPDLWGPYPSSTHTSCFTGCTNASNYASIPTGWK